jgi:sodium/proline symporter
MLLDLLPFWLAGILLAGILAAIMSTADSQLLVLTSSVSEDILHKALGFKLSDQQLVIVSRITIIIPGILGLIIAFTSKSLVYTVVSWAWAGIGNSFQQQLF